MKFAYLGNCVDTVDAMNYWDATEMAQVVANSQALNISLLVPFIFDTDDTELKQRVIKYPECFECGIHRMYDDANDANDANSFYWNCDIAWIYDEKLDIHHFFECY